MLSRRKDEGQNKISCRLLNHMAYLHRVSLQLELVAINIDVQVEIFILVAFAIQEKATLWVPLAELGLEQLYGLFQRDRSQIMDAGHEDILPCLRGPSKSGSRQRPAQIER